MKHKFTIAFAIVIAFVAWEDVKQCHDLPWPPRYIGAGITFGLLDLVSVLSDELASVIAFGFVSAVIMNTLAPNKVTGSLSFITGGGDRCHHNNCSEVQNPTTGNFGPNVLPNNPTCPDGTPRLQDGTCVPGTVT